MTTAIESLIPEISELQSWLAASFKAGREKVQEAATTDLANMIVCKMAAAAANGKRSVEVDWEAMLDSFPTVFRRKAVKAVHAVLVSKGYYVYGGGLKGEPWKLRPSHVSNVMTVIVPGKVEVSDAE